MYGSYLITDTAAMYSCYLIPNAGVFSKSNRCCRTASVYIGIMAISLALDYLVLHNSFGEDG